MLVSKPAIFCIFVEFIHAGTEDEGFAKLGDYARWMNEKFKIKWYTQFVTLTLTH